MEDVFGDPFASCAAPRVEVVKFDVDEKPVVRITVNGPPTRPQIWQDDPAELLDVHHCYQSVAKSVGTCGAVDPTEVERIWKRGKKIDIPPVNSALSLKEIATRFKISITTASKWRRSRLGKKPHYDPSSAASIRHLLPLPSNFSLLIKPKRAMELYRVNRVTYKRWRSEFKEKLKSLNDPSLKKEREEQRFMEWLLVDGNECNEQCI